MRKDNLAKYESATSKSTLSDVAIQSALEPYGVATSPELARLVREYAKLLLRWNWRIHLTSLEDTEEILKFHFGESLFALNVASIEHGRLADVGTGAGFPGLALKLARPGVDVSLLESNTKKCVFVEEVIRSLELPGVKVVRGRFEALESDRPYLDFVTSRALGQFKGLLAWADKVLLKAGQVILWLGKDDAEEVSKAPGFEWQVPIKIPQSKRRFILVGRRM